MTLATIARCGRLRLARTAVETGGLAGGRSHSQLSTLGGRKVRDLCALPSETLSNRLAVADRHGRLSSFGRWQCTRNNRFFASQGHDSLLPPREEESSAKDVKGKTFPALPDWGVLPEDDAPTGTALSLLPEYPSEAEPNFMFDVEEMGSLEESASDYFMSPGSVLYQTPKGFLSDNIKRLPGKGSIKFSNYYVTERIKMRDTDGKGISLWTASFESPIDGEIFAAGSLKEGHCESKRVGEIGGRVFYHTKNCAEHAAAARYIDCLSLREFRKRSGFDAIIRDENVMRLCVEEPYEASADMELKKGQEVDHVMRPILLDTSNSPTSRENVSASTSSKNDQVKAAEEGRSLDDPSASTFVLPESNDLEDAELRNIHHAEQDEEEYTIQHLPGTGIAHGARDSIHGGAKIILPTTMERILEAWVEAPTTKPVPSAPSIQVTASYSPGSALLPHSASDFAMMDAVSNALAWYRRLEHGISGSKGDRIKGDQSSQDRSGGKKRWFQPKEFVGTLQQTPVSVAACNAILNALGKANSASEYDCVAVSGADRGTLSAGMESNIDVEALAQQIVDRMLREQSAVDAGDSGTKLDFSGMNLCRKPNTETFNAYLRCIRRSTRIDTATAAEEFLNDMVAGKDFGGHALPPPDTETFNNVIHLWSSVPGQLSRKKVNELYMKLEMHTRASDSDTGHSHRPNRSTFLSALSLLTQCDGEGADIIAAYNFRDDEAKEWICRMESLATMYGDDELRPDTEIYNAPLRWSGGMHRKGAHNKSSVASPWDDYSIFDDGFKALPPESADLCTENAQKMEKWLLDMEKLSADDPRVSPNIETYESVIQAWVRTGTLDGVLQAEEWAKRAIQAALEATDVNMSNPICPRFQTFHPIIAAWARCGFPERVKEWEQILEELSTRMPEMKPDGRMKAALILAWRKHQIFSDCPSSMVFDSTSAPPEYSSAESSDSIPSKVEDSFSAARACTECLEDICSKLREQLGTGAAPFTFLNASSVGHVINAWGDAALHAAANRGEQKAECSSKHAFSEMLRTVSIVDDIIDMFIRSFNEEKAHDYPDQQSDVHSKDFFDENSRQMRHLMHNSHRIYANAIEHLRKTDEARTGTAATDRAAQPSFFASYFPSVETMVRRAEDHRKTFDNFSTEDTFFLSEETNGIENMKSFADEEVLRHVDLFSYENDAQSVFSPSNSTLSEGWEGSNESHVGSRHQYHNLFLEALQACESLTSPTQYGDAIRLVLLIMRSISSPNPGQEQTDLADIYVQMIKLVEEVVPDSHERKTLVYRLQEEAQQSIRDSASEIARLRDMDLIAQAVQNVVDEDYATKTLRNGVEPTNKRPGGQKRRVAIKRRHGTAKRGAVAGYLATNAQVGNRARKAKELYSSGKA